MKRFILLAFLWPGLLAADEPLVSRFLSPAGKFEVSFEPQDRRMYPNPHAKALPEGTQTKLYRVSFYMPASATPMATTYFTDIGLAPGVPFPTPVMTLAKGILWSPEEDFAVLPYERWPAPDGRPTPRQAVSLNSQSSWQYVDFPFSGDPPLIWQSPLAVAGNRIDGCTMDIAIFDGKTGKTSTLQEANPPEGYLIRSWNDQMITMQKVLSSCATESDRARFQEECVVYDLRFGRREIGVCH